MSRSDTPERPPLYDQYTKPRRSLEKTKQIIQQIIPTRVILT